MSNIVEKTERLLRVLDGQRQKGRTTAVLNVAKESNAIVLFPSQHMASTFSNRLGRGKARCAFGNLDGIDELILLDHATYESMIKQLLQEISMLEKDNSSLERKLKMIEEIVKSGH
jgi:hypothetical protein